MLNEITVREEFYDKILNNFTIENKGENLPLNFNCLQKQLFLSAIKNVLANGKADWFTIILHDIMVSLNSENKECITFLCTTTPMDVEDSTIIYKVRLSRNTNKLFCNIGEVLESGKYVEDVTNMQTLDINNIVSCLRNLFNKTSIDFDSVTIVK